jgi:tetraacyldisaccharide 4'-kinase
MRAPDFFGRENGTTRLLAPLSGLYAAISRIRLRWTTPWRAPVPIICVGNLTAGGAGKTPVALALGALLAEQDRQVHFLSRGYGGRLRGPEKVDRTVHSAHDVGDEPLLLAEIAPTWIARNRVAGAKAAIADGAAVIVMDDGFQNPTLAKSLSLVVVDGGFGFGNGRVLPAGPLREPVAEGLARADAVILIEPDSVGMADFLNETLDAPPIIHARLTPLASAERYAGRKVLAFAGIGRPEKFFTTVESLGCTLVARRSFPDHHKFSADEIMQLVESAQKADAIPLTTAKDLARLPPDARKMIEAVPVALEWRNPEEIEQLVTRALDN